MLDLDRIDAIRSSKEVKRMVALSSARAADNIVIVGPRSLGCQVALLRLGFDRVAGMSGDSPHACGEPINHLFITGPLADHRLARVIAALAPKLGRHGSVAAQLREARQDDIISRTLTASGFSSQSPTLDSSPSVLSVRRLDRPDRLAIAA